MGAIGTEDEEGYRTGPPGYIGWRNSFLGIDSGDPYTFKNTGSDFNLGEFVEYGDEVCIVAAGEDLRLRGKQIVAKLVQQTRHQHVQVSTEVNIR
jgi:hypothetical protein